MSAHIAIRCDECANTVTDVDRLYWSRRDEALMRGFTPADVREIAATEAKK